MDSSALPSWEQQSPINTLNTTRPWANKKDKVLGTVHDKVEYFFNPYSPIHYLNKYMDFEMENKNIPEKVSKIILKSESDSFNNLIKHMKLDHGGKKANFMMRLKKVTEESEPKP